MSTSWNISAGIALTGALVASGLVVSRAAGSDKYGMCALGPAVCAVANVAALLASNAIGSGGGIRCGTKSLRVYPVSHRAPRCA
jgi:hypothetical protein